MFVGNSGLCRSLCRFVIVWCQSNAMNLPLLVDFFFFFFWVRLFWCSSQNGLLIYKTIHKKVQCKHQITQHTHWDTTLWADAAKEVKRFYFPKKTQTFINFVSTLCSVSFSMEITPVRGVFCECVCLMILFSLRCLIFWSVRYNFIPGQFGFVRY